MRSGTSFFDWTLFKKNFSRFWPIWASYLVIWLFALPIDILASFGGRSIGSIEGYYFGVVSSANAHLWFALFYGLFAAMAVLSHLYASRSANFYGALPVRREGIFLTQYLSGYAFVVLPQIIVAVFTAVIGFAWGAAPVLPCLAWLGVGMGTMFFFYTFAFLCGVFTGHILALPAFYAILNGLAVMVYELIDTVIERSYYGFAGFGDAVDSLVEWLTPAAVLRHVDLSYNRRTAAVAAGGEEYLLIYCAVAVVFLVCAFFLYKHRKLESAGDVVSYRFVRPVFKYGVAVCVGLFLGFVTSEIIGEATLPVMVVIWTVLGCFAAQMLLDKTFRVFKKWKGALAVGVVMAAVMACVVLDVTGFETWVPDAEDVKSVRVSLSTRSNLYDDGIINDLTVTDPRVIEDLITIHKNAVEHPAFGRGADEALEISLVYRTATGERSRRYNLRFRSSDVNTSGTAAWALEDIYANRALYWEIYGFADLEKQLAAGKRLKAVDYDYTYLGNNTDPELSYSYFADGGGARLAFSSYGDMMSLYEAVKKDFFEGRIGMYRVGDDRDYDSMNSRKLRFYYSADETDGQDYVVLDDDQQYVSIYGKQYISISVTPESTNTLEVLFRLIPEELKDQGLLSE